MSIKPPTYIPVNEIQKLPIIHTWNDWDPYAVLGKRSETTMNQLSQLTDRAKIAYSIGCAEWVLFRFPPEFFNETPLDFIEACWAFEMNNQIYPPKEFEEKEWKGSVKAPIDLALITILNTYYLTEDGSAEVEGALAELIATHVLNNSKIFLSWKTTAINRLIKYYPRSNFEKWGRPVPREALDPSVSLSLELEEQFVKNFLGNLDFEQNNLLKHFDGDNSV